MLEGVIKDFSDFRSNFAWESIYTKMFLQFVINFLTLDALLVGLT